MIEGGVNHAFVESTHVPLLLVLKTAAAPGTHRRRADTLLNK
jgi:hypothetical protein